MLISNDGREKGEEEKRFSNSFPNPNSTRILLQEVPFSRILGDKSFQGLVLLPFYQKCARCRGCFRKTPRQAALCAPRQESAVALAQSSWSLNCVCRGVQSNLSPCALLVSESQLLCQRKAATLRVESNPGLDLSRWTHLIPPTLPLQSLAITNKDEHVQWVGDRVRAWQVSKWIFPLLLPLPPDMYKQGDNESEELKKPLPHIQY